MAVYFRKEPMTENDKKEWVSVCSKGEVERMEALIEKFGPEVFHLSNGYLQAFIHGRDNVLKRWVWKDQKAYQNELLNFLIQLCKTGASQSFIRLFDAEKDHLTELHLTLSCVALAYHEMDSFKHVRSVMAVSEKDLKTWVEQFIEEKEWSQRKNSAEVLEDLVNGSDVQIQPELRVHWLMHALKLNRPLSKAMLDVLHGPEELHGLKERWAHQIENNILAHEKNEGLGWWVEKMKCSSLELVELLHLALFVKHWSTVESIVTVFGDQMPLNMRKDVFNAMLLNPSGASCLTMMASLMPRTAEERDYYGLRDAFQWAVAQGVHEGAGLIWNHLDDEARQFFKARWGKKQLKAAGDQGLWNSFFERQDLLCSIEGGEPVRSKGTFKKGL